MVNIHGSFLKKNGVELPQLIYVCVFLRVLLLSQLVIRAESSGDVSPRALDSLLQDYAFRALDHPKTGVIYDGDTPCNLSGVKIAAMRVNSFTMKKKGIGWFKEIHIPKGVIESPSASKVVLVYQNLGNLSELYYPLPGFTFLAPVLGFLAYKGHDLSAKNLPGLDIQACNEPIMIKFPNLKRVPEGLIPMCVHFCTNGAVEFGYVINGNVCASVRQGHFSIVVPFRPWPSPPPPPPPSPPPPPPPSPPPPPPPSPSPPPPPSPSPSPPPPPPPSPPPPPPPSPPPPKSPPPPHPAPIPSPAPAPAPEGGGEDGGDGKGKYEMWSTIGYVAGGFLIFILIVAMFIVCLQNYGEEPSLVQLWLHIPYFSVIQRIEGVNENVTLLSDGHGVYEVVSGSTRPLLENDFVI